MRGFTYNGTAIVIPRSADIPRGFRPDGRWAKEVQSTIDSIEPWKGSSGVIETLRDDDWDRILPMAVQTTREPVVWGQHVGHQAQSPGLSPFTRIHVVDEDTRWITVEFVGTVNHPVLVRAYGGDVTPPLPWMQSARGAEGGISACREYWQTHAYLQFERGHLINKGTETHVPPSWYRG